MKAKTIIQKEADIFVKNYCKTSKLTLDDPIVKNLRGDICRALGYRAYRNRIDAENTERAKAQSELFPAAKANGVIEIKAALREK